jgi:hypothetical protein
MSRSVFDESNSRTYHNPRSDDDRQSARSIGSEERRFLYGPGRFKPHLDCASSILTSLGDDVSGAPINIIESRLDNDRRSGSDRRCGVDTRNEVERFFQGERRSGADRRSARRRQYRSFKKARAFVRSLGLKSESEWRDYVNSGKGPDDIPLAPHECYANDGWAGWGDWLGVSALHMSRYYHRIEKICALVRGLRLKSIKWHGDEDTASLPVN